jgi:hypothetical protein
MRRTHSRLSFFLSLLGALVPKRRRMRMGIDATGMSDEEFEAAYMAKLMGSDPDLANAMFEQATNSPNVPTTLQ